MNLYRMRVVLIFCCLAILLLIAIRLELEQALGIKGPELESLNLKIKKYKLENMVLKNQYLQITSYTNISGQAAQMGFVPAQIVYLR